jgi:hypothetical protein
MVLAIFAPKPEVVIGARCADLMKKLTKPIKEAWSKRWKINTEAFFERFEAGRISEIGITEALPSEPVLSRDISSAAELLEQLSALPDLRQLYAIQACQDVLSE